MWMSSKESHMLQMQQRRTLQHCMQIQGQECQSPWGASTANSSSTFQSYICEEYTAVYFKADVHTLKTATVKILTNSRPEPQIRPLWLSKAISSQIHCIGSEVNTRGKLQHPDALQSEDTFWRKHPIKTTNSEADWLQWQPNQEPWLHHSVSLPR